MWPPKCCEATFGMGFFFLTLFNLIFNLCYTLTIYHKNDIITTTKPIFGKERPVKRFTLQRKAAVLKRTPDPADFARFRLKPSNASALQDEFTCVADEDGVLDWTKIISEQFVSGESSISGTEWLARAARSKNIQLGFLTFLALWENYLACKSADEPEGSILEQLYRGKQIPWKFFFVRDPVSHLDGSHRLLIHMYRVGCRLAVGEWDWNTDVVETLFGIDYQTSIAIKP